MNNQINHDLKLDKKQVGYLVFKKARYDKYEKYPKEKLRSNRFFIYKFS